MQIITHRKHAINITQGERVASAIGGGILAAAGLKRASLGGLALAAIGGDLLRRGITGHSFVYEAIGIRTAEWGQGAETTAVPYELGIRVDRAITIERPREEVYRFFRNLENLPQFMKHVVSVRQTDGGRSHWVVKAPAGRTVEWDAVVHNEVPNELLAWRTLPGSTVQSAGAVRFEDAPNGRGTEIHIELQYNPPGGMLGAALAMLWGEEPGMQLQDDLHRLKQILELGEVLTTEGQPSGRVQPMRAAREHEHEEREVQLASEGSFPASDSPAYNH